MTEEIHPGEGNVFLQTSPSTAYAFLTCTDVSDISQPQGGATTTYKPDVNHSGKFKVSGSIEGSPGAVTFTLTRPLSTVVNYLLEQKCPPNIRINWVCRGQRNSITNYQLGVVLYNAKITSKSIVRPVAATPDNNTQRVNTGAEMSADGFTMVYQLSGSRQTLTSTTHAYTIAFRPEECTSKCGTRVDFADEGWLGLESDSYTVGYALKTVNGGSTWAAPTDLTDIFGDAGDVSDILFIETYSGYRVILSRGSAVGGAPAEIAYSDDGGVSWTNVNVGSTNGQTIQAMCADEAGYLWAAVSGGYIYRSTNSGQTWTAMESGVETAQTLYDIVMVSDVEGYAVGGSNAFLRTADGTTWDLVTGPSTGNKLTTVAVNYAGDIYVGAEDGAIYASVDEGDTWSTILDIGTGHVERIRFDPESEYIGYLVYNSAAALGALYRTEDGGVTWTAITTPVNSGLNDLAVLDANTVFVCGNAHGGTTFVAKFIKTTS